ncbi:MAG TPA: group III truncated hemoglobin [Bryobacteraceae bacterium]
MNEDSIADMVDTFYGAIRQDRLLGPIFDGAIGEDWAPHLSKMKAFWATVLLASRTYKGNPMMAHLALPRLTESHFARWLELWRETAAQLCSNGPAEVFVQKAEMIGARLLGAISRHHEHFAAEVRS